MSELETYGSTSPRDKALRLVNVATVLKNESGLKFLEGTKYDIWPSKCKHNQFHEIKNLFKFRLYTHRWGSSYKTSDTKLASDCGFCGIECLWYCLRYCMSCVCYLLQEQKVSYKHFQD